VQAVHAWILGRDAEERAESVDAVADVLRAVDFAAFEVLVARVSTAGAVVEANVESLPAVRADLTGRLRGDADQRLVRARPVDTVAHVHRALDLRTVERAVAVVIETHLDALSAVLAIRPGRLAARRDEAVQSVVAVLAVLTVDSRVAIRTGLAVLAVLTVDAVPAVLAVRYRAGGSVRAFDGDFACFFVVRHRARRSRRARGTPRTRCSVFAPAPCDHHHEARERTTDDPRAPNPVPGSHLDESFLVPGPPSSAGSGSTSE
jgi:hypothetical protein